MTALSILDLVRVRQGSDARAALDGARALAAHAEGLGYTLANEDALSEFRAVHVGLWAAQAALFAVAARVPGDPG